MTKHERAELDALLQTKNNSIALTAFKRAVYKPYQHAPHLNKIDELLSQVERFIATKGAEGIGRVIIECPPRHGKTITVSRLFPAWVIGRNPDIRLMLVSYGATLADKNSRAVRNFIRSDAYRRVFPDIRLAEDSQAVQAWDIAEHEGGADGMGIGGGATGKGAHLLIIDDPVKNREEAESATYRNKVWDSYTDDLYTRLEPGGAVVVMMTRWHEDDLIGRLLKNEPGKWTRLRLPALAEPDDPLEREPGAALWPARYPLDKLQDIQSTLGSYSFSALYQQSPLPSGGGLFKTEALAVLDYEPECVRTVRFWDLAITAKKSADYTAGVKLGEMQDGTFVVLDVYRAQAEFPDVQERIIQTAHIDGKATPIFIEGEKAGIIALAELLRDPRMYPYSVQKITPQGDKYSRALPFAARVEAGRVKLARGAWNRAYIDELAAFPMADHDDQVDASSGAYDALAQPENIFFDLW